MFLNFPLPLLFRSFSGIDLLPYQEVLGFGHLPSKEIRWERRRMGFRPSPYYAVRFYHWAEEFARGNRREKGNLLRWDEVRLNLPDKFSVRFSYMHKWIHAGMTLSTVLETEHV